MFFASASDASSSSSPPVARPPDPPPPVVDCDAGRNNCGTGRLASYLVLCSFTSRSSTDPAIEPTTKHTAIATRPRHMTAVAFISQSRPLTHATEKPDNANTAATDFARSRGTFFMMLVRTPTVWPAVSKQTVDYFTDLHRFLEKCSTQNTGHSHFRGFPPPARVPSNPPVRPVRRHATPQTWVPIIPSPVVRRQLLAWCPQRPPGPSQSKTRV